jgi:DNA-binding HxlR family transcriptional regulator
MMTKTPYDNRFVLHRASEVLCDGWTFLVLREAFFGARRFEQFREKIEIPRGRLTERLLLLLDNRIFQKRQYLQHPPRYEYLLTEMGHDLYEMTLMMKQWGDCWRPQMDSLQLVHLSCGEILRPKMICSWCTKSIQFADIGLSPETDQPLPPPSKIRRQVNSDAFVRDQRNDPVARTLAVMGDQWTLMVLFEAFHGNATFGSFIERLGISRGTLSDRLGKLVDQGILHKESYSSQPPRYSYQLTPAGTDMFPIFLSMIGWGRKWLFESGPHLVPMTHNPCSKPLSYEVICQTCRKPVTSREVQVLAR